MTLIKQSASVLIRTKNEAAAIGKALNLVTSQLFKPEEIIVVDSGSTDGTVEIIRQWEDVKLIQISPDEFTFGGALNIGFEAAHSDIVVPLSGHAFPCNERWLGNFLRHFDDPQAAGVYGRQLPHPEAWPPVKRDYLSGSYGDQLRIQENLDDPRDHFFSNANAAIRRTCWERHPFNETMPYCEDWEWARAMLQRGYKIVYEPEAAVYHSHNDTLLKACWRTYSEASAAKLLYRRREMSIRKALRLWQKMVLDDVNFVRQNGRDFKWLLWSPVYRFFWTYGWLRPDMPGALWRPFVRRWKGLWTK